MFDRCAVTVQLPWHNYLGTCDNVITLALVTVQLPCHEWRHNYLGAGVGAVTLAQV